MKRRLLPESAYDFYAHDSRDGERRPVRDSLREAQKDARNWRAALASWKRCVITVRWEINERKVLRLLRGRPEGSGQGGSG